MKKELRKSYSDRVISGVCGGLAEYFNIDVSIVRIIWVCSVLFLGFGILPYIIFAICMKQPARY